MLAEKSGSACTQHERTTRSSSSLPRSSQLCTGEAQAKQLKAPGWDTLPPLIGLEMFHDAALWIAKVQGKKRCGGQLSSPTRQILVATAVSKHTIWSHKN